MNVARILYPVRVLGPGNRTGIWLCGCSRACKGCSNPELWKQKPEYEVSPSDVYKLIQTAASSYAIDGFTISGGEPMDQASSLGELLKLITEISDDILIYSGYRIEELRARCDPATESVLLKTAVLIDGAYIEEQNDNSVLRGSANQRIHVLNRKYETRYQRYLSETHNQIQNFTTADGIVSVGIHHRGWKSV